MIDLVSDNRLAVAVLAATSLLCLASALVISAVVLLNRGAKANLAWGLFAVGLLAIGISEGDRALAALGLPNLTGLRDLIRLYGALMIFCGAAYYRGLLKRLVK